MPEKEINIIPDEVDVEIDGDDLYYYERYKADDIGAAETLANNTADIVGAVTESIEKEYDSIIDIESSVDTNGEDVVAFVSMSPADETEVEHIPHLVVAIEMMTVLAIRRPHYWDLVVEFTGGLKNKVDEVAE